MKSELWEPHSTADKWGSLELSSGGEIVAKSNYYYPIDPKYYIDLFRRGESKLTSVEIWPNNLCNQKCSFCNGDIYNLKGNESLQFEIVHNLINDLAELDNQVVRFSGGGEPSLFEGIADIIELIAKRNMASFFITNGINLNNDLISALTKYSSLIRFSFNGGNRTDYTDAHGCDHYDIAVENMKRVASARKQNGREKSLLLGATFILTPQNFEHLGDAVKTVRDCGFNYMLIRPKSPFPEPLAGPAYDVFKEQLSLGQAMTESDFYVGGKLRKLDGTKPKVPLCRACYVTRVRAYVTAEGNVSSCFDGICNRQNVFGNLYNCSFKDIWEKETHLDLRRRLTRGEFLDFCHNHCGNADFNRSLDEMLLAIENDPDVKLKKSFYPWIERSSQDESWF